MTISSLKDFKQILKACRENGVTTIEVDGIKMNIQLKEDKKSRYDVSEDFPEASIKVPAYNGIGASVQGTPGSNSTNSSIVQAATKIATDELTEEQLLNWSVATPPGLEENQQ